MPPMIPQAEQARDGLIAIALLRLARRQAAVVLLRQSWRTAADTVADRSLRPEILLTGFAAVAETLAFSVTVARLGGGRRDRDQHGSGGDDERVFHSPAMIEALR